MPAPRKACERCRYHKAKCIWSDDSTACVRCRRSNYTCSAPPAQASTRNRKSTFKGGETLSRQRDSQIERIEGLLLTGVRHTPGSPKPGRNLYNDVLTLTAVEESGFEFSMEEPTGFAQKSGVSVPDLRAASSLITLPGISFSAISELPLVSGSCSKTGCYLPPPDEGHMLLREYLYDFNSKLPLFSPKGIYTLFRDCYSGAANEKPLAWVLVYVVMGITHRLRAMSLFAVPNDTSQADWYLGQCLNKLPELLMHSPSLMLIQALLSISILLQTSGRYQRAPLFVSTALQMAQDLGYNEVTPGQPTGSVSSLEKSYVFWIAFMMDAHFSMASLRPSAQRLADISTPMPAESVENWWESSDLDASASQWNLNVFALHSSLAIIEAEAAEELFSAKARRRAPISNAGIYQNIMFKLHVWRGNNALSNLDAKDVSRAMYRSDIIHSIMLEGAYFRTLYQLHATNALVGFSAKFDAFAPEALQSMIDLGIVPCHCDAERFLRLVALVPQGNLSTTWASMEPIVAALCTLLSAHAIGQHELNARKTANLQLCKDILVALDFAAENGVDPAYVSANDLCRSVYSRAQKS